MLIASQLGDVAWRELLSRHFETVRAQIERFGGSRGQDHRRRASGPFAGPAQALHCALAICHAANREAFTSVRHVQRAP
jgi:class 3 adenylate cyclase